MSHPVNFTATKITLVVINVPWSLGSSNTNYTYIPQTLQHTGPESLRLLSIGPKMLQVTSIYLDILFSILCQRNLVKLLANFRCHGRPAMWYVCTHIVTWCGYWFGAIILKNMCKLKQDFAIWSLPTYKRSNCKLDLHMYSAGHSKCLTYTSNFLSFTHGKFSWTKDFIFWQYISYSYFNVKLY